MSKKRRSKSYLEELREKQIAKRVMSAPGWRTRIIDHDIAAKRGRIKSSSLEGKAKRMSSVVSGGLPSLGKR
jgi:hypothetical protein